MFVNYEDSLQGIILKVSIFSLLKPGCTFTDYKYLTGEKRCFRLVVTYERRSHVEAPLYPRVTVSTYFFDPIVETFFMHVDLICSLPLKQDSKKLAKQQQIQRRTKGFTEIYCFMGLLGRAKLCLQR